MRGRISAEEMREKGVRGEGGGVGKNKGRLSCVLYSTFSHVGIYLWYSRVHLAVLNTFPVLIEWTPTEINEKKRIWCRGVNF